MYTYADFVKAVGLECDVEWKVRWTAMLYAGQNIGRFLTGRMSKYELLKGCIELPYIDLEHSAHLGAVGSFDRARGFRKPKWAHIAMGLEMAMIQEGATRLTTRDKMFPARFYKQHGRLPHEEDFYFTQVPEGEIDVKLGMFKKYSVFSYGNEDGPQLFARYLNCVNLHLMGSLDNADRHLRYDDLLLEIWYCYSHLVRAGIYTLGKIEDAFVITDEIATLILCDQLCLTENVYECTQSALVAWLMLSATIQVRLWASNPDEEKAYAKKWVRENKGLLNPHIRTFKMYARDLRPKIIQENRSECKIVGINRCISMSYIAETIGLFVTGIITKREVLDCIIGLPDLDYENAVIAHPGTLPKSCSQEPSIFRNPNFAYLAVGIEIAMFHDGPTKLSTKSLDFAGRFYTENGDFEEYENHYLTHVPRLEIGVKLRKFKTSSVFFYRNEDGPRFFARYLNCIELHMHGHSPEASYGNLLLEIWRCYSHLIRAGLDTIENVEDSFVITDEIMTLIIGKQWVLTGNVFKCTQYTKVGWLMLAETIKFVQSPSKPTEEKDYARKWIRENIERLGRVVRTYKMFERYMSPKMMETNKFGSNNVGIIRWKSMFYIAETIGMFVTGIITKREVLDCIIGVPDTLKILSMGSKNADMLCYSANMGALSNVEIPRILNDALTGCIATGIEMSIFRNGPTRLTTRAVDVEGRAYTENRNMVSYFEEEGQKYFMYVPDEDISSRLSMLKIYRVFWYTSRSGPEFFARFLSCVKMHLSNLPNWQKGSFTGGLLEIWNCYRPLIVQGLKLIRDEKDSFVVTDEVMTAIITKHKFEILGDVSKLPEDEKIAWRFLTESMISIMGLWKRTNLTTRQIVQKYPELLVNDTYAIERLRDYTFGPDLNWERIQNTETTGRGIVEHLGDNRDIPKLTERRRINGFGTVAPPPETNSSISTTGRRRATFSLEGRECRFQITDGGLSFEVIDDDGSKFRKKFTKKKRTKLKMGDAEVARIIESSGDFGSLSDLVEEYLHNSNDVEGRIWLLAALRTRADISDDSSCIFDAVSGFRPRWEGTPLVVRSAVRCDILEAVDVFVSSDEKDERIFLDYSSKPGTMLRIWGTGGMKCARAVEVDRGQLLRARIELDYDFRCNSYIANRG